MGEALGHMWTCAAHNNSNKFGTKVISLIAISNKYRIAFDHLSHPERVCYRI
jgi:hypothetical protein